MADVGMMFINESYTLYGEGLVIEYPAVNDNCSCYGKTRSSSFGPLLVAMMLASCNSIPSAFAPDETATTGVTRQTNETRPERSAKIQPIQSVVDITNRIL